MYRKQRRDFTGKIINGILGIIATMTLIATPAHSQKIVLAHYMVTNQDYQGNTSDAAKVSAYEREILQAQAAGYDGFALNCGGWINQTYYITYSTQMFEAAAALNNGFKLCFSVDMCCGNAANDAKDMVRRFCNDSRYSGVCLKVNNKFLLTTFSGDGNGTGFWQGVRNDLASGAGPVTPPAGFSASSNAAVQITLIPAFFWGGEVPTQSSVQSGFNQWSGTIDGSFYWGIAGVPGSGGSQDQILSSDAYASVVHGGGKLYMAPVCFQFWGANANRYFEYSGYSGLRKMWMDAINTSHPDLVEDITWNDFVEGSYVSPIDDPNKYPNANFLQFTNQGFYHSHIGATDLTPFFIQWYKNGAMPAITKDTIFWAYRTHSMNVNPGNPSVGSKFGPVSDSVYVTCNLQSAATLKVTFGSTVQTVNVNAGSSDVSVPFTAGFTPNFQLIRGSTTVINANGTDQIQTNPTLNDYYYSTGDASGSGGTITAPGAPSNLTASAGNSQVTLNWTAGSGATSYNIYRGTSAGGESTTAIATNVGGAPYTNTGLTNGTKYYYTVKAVNSAGTSGASNEASATPAAATIQGIDLVVTSVTLNPSAPTTGSHVVFSAVVKNQGNTATPAGTIVGCQFAVDGVTTPLNWSDNDTASLAAGASVTLTATGGTNGVNYWTATSGSHTVQAWVDDVNRIAEANENNNKTSQAFTVGAGGTAPAAPTGLTATAGNAQVALSWPASSGATSYNVYRGTATGGEGTTAVGTATGTTFTNTGLTNGTKYFFTVKAVNSVGTSGASPEANATPTAGGVTGIDLLVTSISWTPTTLSSGAHVVFSAVVKNQGSVATPAGTVIGCQFAIDGVTTPITWSDTNSASLAPGASVTLTANNGTNAVNYWPAVSGTHTVQAWVDDVNRIGESNETNNKTTASITVP